MLVVDDAYSEYMKNTDYSSGLDLFRNRDNVFILRTFSKMFGLASLRVGWGYGSKKIVNALNVIKPPFNVNGTSLVSSFLEVLETFSASDKTLPSFEKILLILIIEYSCLCPFFLLELCLLLFLKINIVLFLLFLIKFASTFAPFTWGVPISIDLSSPYARISLNSILVSGLESGNFSILRISPDLTLYCFPPHRPSWR